MGGDPMGYIADQINTIVGDSTYCLFPVGDSGPMIAERLRPKLENYNALPASEINMQLRKDAKADLEPWEIDFPKHIEIPDSDYWIALDTSAESGLTIMSAYIGLMKFMLEKAGDISEIEKMNILLALETDYTGVGDIVYSRHYDKPVSKVEYIEEKWPNELQALSGPLARIGTRLDLPDCDLSNISDNSLILETSKERKDGHWLLDLLSRVVKRTPEKAV
jgi:hypothetical protein